MCLGSSGDAAQSDEHAHADHDDDTERARSELLKRHADGGRDDRSAQRG
jgi:hypothetical protein